MQNKKVLLINVQKTLISQVIKPNKNLCPLKKAVCVALNKLARAAFMASSCSCVESPMGILSLRATESIENLSKYLIEAEIIQP